MEEADARATSATQDCNLTSDSARRRVLGKPIILSQIIETILEDEDKYWHTEGCPVLQTAGYESTQDDGGGVCHPRGCVKYGLAGVVSRCSQVNAFWYHEAIPVLWRKPYIYTIHYLDSLLPIFSSIDPKRRQFYANFVEDAVLWSVDTRDNQDGNLTLLRDIEFPRLKHLNISLDSGQLPEGRFSQVESITLDPHNEYYPRCMGVTQDELDRLLKDIPVFFPRLKRIELIDYVLERPNAVRDFLELYPHVKFEGQELVLIREN